MRNPFCSLVELLIRDAVCVCQCFAESLLPLVLGENKQRITELNIGCINHDVCLI